MGGVVGWTLFAMMGGSPLPPDGAATAAAPVGSEGATAAVMGPPAPGSASAASAAAVVPAGHLKVTVWVVHCPPERPRFDPSRGEPDHLDQADFLRMVAEGVLVVDDQVSVVGRPDARLHGERRQDLPRNAVFAPTTDHVGLDLDVTVTPGGGGGEVAVDLALVRRAVVHIAMQGDGATTSMPTIQSGSWKNRCTVAPGALRFVGQGLKPGGDVPQAVLVAVTEGGHG
jgi:hypothetical protein